MAVDAHRHNFMPARYGQEPPTNVDLWTAFPALGSTMGRAAEAPPLGVGSYDAASLILISNKAKRLGARFAVGLGQTLTKQRGAR
ncbi:MAG: hypothetical protein FD152_4010 [Xanthobacteraceae bacterium]|nr:MAG: hypothetical protein FD152_4010 [Xanthobacteraceae bacterium]